MAIDYFEKDKKIISTIQNGRFILNKRFRELRGKNIKTILNITCTKCNNTYDIERSTFLRNTKHETGGCKYCSKRAISSDDINKDLLNIENNYTINTNKNIIKNRRQNINVTHKKCGYSFDTNIYTIQKYGEPCKRCSSIEPTSIEAINLYINNNNLSYSLIDFKNAQNVHDKITLSHIDPSCIAKGKYFNMTINNFKNKHQRCPYCNVSHGENNINLYFKNKNLNYIYQYKNKTCKSIRILPFDFKYKNILIEFDGEQHFSYDEYFCKTEDEFQYRKICDQIKNEWCKNNNFKLLRIGYKELDNLEQILDDVLTDSISLNKNYKDIYYYNSDTKLLIESGIYQNFFNEDTNIMQYLEEDYEEEEY